MTRLMRAALVSAAALLMTLAFAGPASAQPHEGELVFDPPSVSEPGEYTVTVTGSDWFAGEALLLSTCVAPIDEPLVPGVSGPAEIGAAIEAWAADPFANCKVTEATTVTPGDDGTFVQDLDVEVVDNFFISVVAAALDDTQQGTRWYQIIDEDAAAAADDAELPVTGSEALALAILGVTLVGAGLLFAQENRRFNRA